MVPVPAPVALGRCVAEEGLPVMRSLARRIHAFGGRADASPARLPFP